jgi:Putative Ig domain
MSVSKFTSSSGLNDFNLNIQATNSTVIFDAEKSQGSYSIVSSSNDTSIDFYAYASDGSLAGYTATKSFTATRNFNKMVILGGTIGDVISFTYKTTYSTAQETAETTAGPFITGVNPSSLPNVNSTTTVSGGNFASGITATFTGTDAVARPAKSVIVGTPQSLIVTRPDVFPVSASPYTLVVSNPGVTDPSGSASNVLSNGITAGAAPSWTTASGSLGTFSKNVPFSVTVVATDADGGSSITYSVVSGYSLPAGLSLGSSTGTISGTPTTSTGPVSFNLRATDSGGNYVDRSFTLADSGPVWFTSGTLPDYGPSAAYSYQLSAPDDSGVAPTYSLASGSLPPGLSLSSTGLISGSAYNGSTSTTYTFTVNATDANGTVSTSSTLSIAASFFAVGTSFTFTAVGTSGQYGPTQSAVQSSYSATSWTQSTANLSVNGGIQYWTVPVTGTYRITAAGAAGGGGSAAGYGGITAATVNLTVGQIVRILCGQMGATGDSSHGSGGGGTFVVQSPYNTDASILCSAGGGGGRGVGGNATTYGQGNYGGSSGQGSGGSSGGTGGGGGSGAGTSGGGNGYAQGADQTGCTWASGGAGFGGNGGANCNVTGARSFINGGAGGNSSSSGNAVGGFGGGGGCGDRGGGAGGYSGGGGGTDNNYSGGGGGYYTIGSSVASTSNANSGAGYVTVQRTA